MGGRVIDNKGGQVSGRGIGFVGFSIGRGGSSYSNTKGFVRSGGRVKGG